jgi:hypothetical protein
MYSGEGDYGVSFLTSRSRTNWDDGAMMPSETLFSLAGP